MRESRYQVHTECADDPEDDISYLCRRTDGGAVRLTESELDDVQVSLAHIGDLEARVAELEGRPELPYPIKVSDAKRDGSWVYVTMRGAWYPIRRHDGEWQCFGQPHAMEFDDESEVYCRVLDDPALWVPNEPLVDQSGEGEKDGS